MKLKGRAGAQSLRRDSGRVFGRVTTLQPMAECQSRQLFLLHLDSSYAGSTQPEVSKVNLNGKLNYLIKLFCISLVSILYRYYCAWARNANWVTPIPAILCKPRFSIRV
jgi:hypothetical protein